MVVKPDYLAVVQGRQVLFCAFPSFLIAAATRVTSKPFPQRKHFSTQIHTEVYVRSVTLFQNMCKRGRKDEGKIVPSLFFFLSLSLLFLSFSSPHSFFHHFLSSSAFPPSSVSCLSPSSSHFLLYLLLPPLPYLIASPPPSYFPPSPISLPFLPFPLPSLPPLIASPLSPNDPLSSSQYLSPPSTHLPTWSHSPSPSSPFLFCVPSFIPSPLPFTSPIFPSLPLLSFLSIPLLSSPLVTPTSPPVPATLPSLSSLPPLSSPSLPQLFPPLPSPTYPHSSSLSPHFPSSPSLPHFLSLSPPSPSFPPTRHFLSLSLLPPLLPSHPHSLSPPSPRFPSLPLSLCSVAPGIMGLDAHHFCKWEPGQRQLSPVCLALL
ncbi:hypothetical protein C7M84_020782 [Penaeus vannamei]|uniref:Uncharacterized protein n=1 Tax=Penaeus vannamei TaxID=6689 RepID=A0A423SBB7_PENVA|nr:hypothetical protein C7M84_020782 [Penaeus vannamei]